MDFHHISVLLNECVEGLQIKPDGVYVDGTMGGAGHTKEICKQLGDNGKVIGVDQDINAINNAFNKLKKFEKTVILQHANFSEIRSILEKNNIKEVDGILLDLGVSSHQLDEASRGFSYMKDAPLDMRMDIRQELSAHTIVNEYSEQDLFEMIKEYGEERWAKRIAEFIVQERKMKEIETTFDLVEVIKKAIPKGARKDGPHPAKRTFQAIRIEVNQELKILGQAIDDMVDLLASRGRLCIITFHSLEDRIVKHRFKKYENPCTCPPEFPACICNKKPIAKVITRKPILPSEEEIEQNSRSRSAKLRILEKL